MDYSLLLGVHHAEPASAGTKARSAANRGVRAAADSGLGRNRGGAEEDEAADADAENAVLAGRVVHRGPLVFSAEGSSRSEGDVYYVAIIDLLQTWTLAKRLERFLKVTLCCRCGAAASGMSVVEPTAYAERFIRMIDRILDVAPPTTPSAEDGLGV